MNPNRLVGIVDYRSGNIRSVINAVGATGADTRLVRAPEDLAGCSHVLLPGVGAFGFCADRLRDSGLLPSLERWALHDGRPLLGICVGMQLMADFSDEQGRRSGLAWIGGAVTKLQTADDPDIRVPHVGWNEAVFRQAFGSFASGEAVDFYFDHSFAYRDSPAGSEVATCRHGEQFSALVRKENIVAAQFHPEKSQAAGMRFLESFLSL